MSEPLVYACVVVGAAGEGQDRAAVAELDDGVAIVLADGSGNSAHGARAAQAVVDAVLVAPAARDWVAVLAELDGDAARWQGGQTTAVVVTVTGEGVTGASVGDSGAWLIRDGMIEELTEAQARKPLLGDGGVPRAFRAGALAGGTLLVASDGLLKYARRADIARVASGDDLAAAARALVELVRLRSGALQDDVSVVLCRGRG